MDATCKKLLVLLFFMVLLTRAIAQPRCKVEYYSTEQGLSHKRVTAIMKDREGFMWFGSWDGINRFDGHRFVSYRSLPGDMSQLRNDRIDQIVEDPSGNLWVLSYDGQVYRFDKKTEQFTPLNRIAGSRQTQAYNFTGILDVDKDQLWLLTQDRGVFCLLNQPVNGPRFINYSKDEKAKYRLPSNKVNVFYKDSDRRIWLGTDKGLICLSPSAEGRYINAGLVPEGFVAAAITGSGEDNTNMYFSTDEGQLILFDKKMKKFSAHTISAERINAIWPSRKGGWLFATTAKGNIITLHLPDLAVKTYHVHKEALLSIYEDQSGALWLEPEQKGVIRFNPATGKSRFFSQTIKDPNKAIGNRYKIFEDNNGTVWVNIKGGGFGYYDRIKGDMSCNLIAANNSTYHLPDIVYSIYYDKVGILWLRVEAKELVKIIFQDNDFGQQLLEEKDFQFAANEVRGLLHDNKGRLWVGAKSGKLYVREKDKWVKGIFDNEPAEGIGQVYTLFQDSRNNIWMGTKKNGLIKAVPLDTSAKRFRLQRFMAGAGEYSLTSNQIYSVTEDRQGRIWVGTFDSGLLLVQEEKDSVKFLHTGIAFKNYPKGGFERIRYMTPDVNGNIWIATTTGLVILDPGDGKAECRYTAYTKMPGDIESLGNNNIQYIYRDTKNRMWLATSGGGFCLANGNDPLRKLTFRNYTTREGLPNDYVLSCTEDIHGNLWLATENGLSKFNTVKQIFRNYDSYDGLPYTSFSEASVSRQMPEGRLVFGTTDGYLSFDPDHIGKDQIPANLVFTNLQINNKDIEPAPDSKLLKQDINYVQALALKYNQNIISIDCAILDQRSGNRQAIAYRLIGFDSTWHDVRQFRRATYTNLPPGSYVFEVKSLNTDLYSNTPYKRLAITIFPPPWKTWWAYLSYGIILLVILIIIRRNALAMIRLRHKIALEQKLAALKLNFFTNVSHELRTPLTLIKGPLEQLSKQEKLSRLGESYVEVAHKNADRMIRFVNNLLDIRKAQSGKSVLQVSRMGIVSFVENIVDHFAGEAVSRNIRLEVQAAQRELVAWADAEKMDVVIYNLLGNAMKFTPDGKKITVSIYSVADERMFMIAVSDEGPGVKNEKLNDIFELFHEGDHATDRALKGSGIGLALCREFVNLHGGQIWARNNAGCGLTVFVKISLGAEHIKNEPATTAGTPAISSMVNTESQSQPVMIPISGSYSGNSEAPLVLLVEDNDELRQFLAVQLHQHYRVETARDGREGWQKALDLLPDLIVSDIMMPEMDGIQMLDHLKNNTDTSHIPVVLLSARYSIESQIEGLKYGADYYITKPFNNEFLLASIDNLVRQRKQLFDALIKKKSPIPLSPGPIVVTSKDELFLKNVIQAVEEKMPDPDFNIEAMAETMAMSRKTFYKKFKSLTGVVPVEFLRDMRLQRAKQYLDTGENNIAEAAYLSGFSSPKYFSTCFREKFHTSPSDYLKSKNSQN